MVSFTFWTDTIIVVTLLSTSLPRYNSSLWLLLFGVYLVCVILFSPVTTSCKLEFLCDWTSHPSEFSSSASSISISPPDIESNAEIVTGSILSVLFLSFSSLAILCGPDLCPPHSSCIFIHRTPEAYTCLWWSPLLHIPHVHLNCRPLGWLAPTVDWCLFRRERGGN